MGFKLTKENNVLHNCRDERMIEWCIKNLEGFGGEQQGKYGFGCECDYHDYNTEEEYKAFEALQEKYRIGYWSIHHEDEDWEEWMYGINDEEIRVYFCSECKSWAVDDDQ